MSEELVVVAEVAGELQAQIIRGMLEAEGIPTMLSQESAGKVYGFTVSSLGSVQILARAEDAERAEQLLQEYDAGLLAGQETLEGETLPEEEPGGETLES